MNLVPAPSSMGAIEFITRFADVYEHSAWLAEKVFKNGLGADEDSVEGLALAFEAVLDSASYNQKLGLVLEHPDLAGRAALNGTLTDASGAEQTSAGLDRCSEQEFERFNRLNAAYREKFRFPFIKAVRGSSRTEILDEFEHRLGNDRPTEFEIALAEINRIARLRLAAIASESKE